MSRPSAIVTALLEIAIPRGAERDRGRQAGRQSETEQHVGGGELAVVVGVATGAALARRAAAEVDRGRSCEAARRSSSTSFAFTLPLPSASQHAAQVFSEWIATTASRSKPDFPGPASGSGCRRRRSRRRVGDAEVTGAREADRREVEVIAARDGGVARDRSSLVSAFA
jgi:hypothetical protein